MGRKSTGMGKDRPNLSVDRICYNIFMVGDPPDVLEIAGGLTWGFNRVRRNRQYRNRADLTGFLAPVYNESIF